MESPISILKPVIDAAECSFVPDPSDYIDDNGFIVCGKCNTRREYLLKIPGSDSYKKVPVKCRCRQEAEDEEEKRKSLAELTSGLRERSFMDERFRSATFQNFIVRPQNEKCYRLLKSYADRFDEMMAKSQGLVLYGSVGTGKTFGAACIANELLDKGVSVVMTSFVKLVDSMRNASPGSETMIDRIVKAKLLIIDDLGAERDTSTAQEKVYDVIDSRYRTKLPLILTTNLRIEDMINESDVRYSRIYDRIFEMCVPIPFEGISWRKAEAARRNDRMKLFMEGRK